VSLNLTGEMKGRIYQNFGWKITEEGGYSFKCNQQLTQICVYVDDILVIVRSLISKDNNVEKEIKNVF